MTYEPQPGRSVPEWVGKTPDSRPPAHVRARIFQKHFGRCHLSGWKITPADQWDLDHIKPLTDGGENRETNLAPALRDKHREKTAQHRTREAKADRMKASFLGLKPKSPSWNRSVRKKMNGQVERRET